MTYAEEDWLALSGLQHFAFCPRQWALIYLEQQWQENSRTAQGHVLHEKAHDAGASETRGDLIILRDLRVFSASLGVTGACDVVEFRRDPQGVPLWNREGRWQPFPVEYKRGEPKDHLADQLQLCCQAICLEEMLCCSIPSGALYYGQTRRRQGVDFTPELRQTVERLLGQMQEYAQRRYTPKGKLSKSCNACSLQEICLPGLSRNPGAAAYLRQAVEEVAQCENC